MSPLNKQVFAGLAFLIIALGALLFIPAWTLAYAQAWAFLAVFFACTLAVTAWLMRHDPKLPGAAGQGGGSR